MGSTAQEAKAKECIHCQRYRSQIMPEQLTTVAMLSNVPYVPADSIVCIFRQ